jgi:predicted ribosome-associated RNA-binding protein Tma20
MFKKPIKIPTHQLKSSEIKKLVEKLKIDYSHINEENWKKVISKEINYGKIQNTETNVYFDSKNPIFFTLKKDNQEIIVPTIYTLSIIPTILKPIYVHSNVSKFIFLGADLMIPVKIKK